ncbi:MAG: hypothetical protein KGH88_05980 [Thaumarchaeota archaeon]|nr:hypothetical protein [Nitrososphaerota archaeon]
MGQEFGTHEWMLTHAVAVDDVSLAGNDTHDRYDPIMTDIMLMILCKAFLLPKHPEQEPQDAE